MTDLEKLKYPIGKFQKPEIIDSAIIENWIKSIAAIPSKIIELTNNLEAGDLSLPYRPNGWNIQEVVHHIPDSHINAYVRLKWTLTEEEPTIKAYNEVKWTGLQDAQMGDIELSLSLLESLHNRWVFLLRSLTDSQLKKSYYHPHDEEWVSIAEYIGRYAWHGEHHLAHIQQALANK